jgi:hypothetical protein
MGPSPVLKEWAPVVGIAIGSALSFVATVRRARKHARRAAFRAVDTLAKVERPVFSAPIAAGVAFLLPVPIYVRATIAVVIWGTLVHRSVLRLVRDSG